MPSYLVVEQDNYPKIAFWANYKSEPFKLPPYYDLRISRQKDNRAWDFEFFHHKIFLTNNPPVIHHFAVSHGYNIFTFKRILKKKDFYWRFGGGFVLPHPENQVRNLKLNDKKGIKGSGYYLSGIAAEGAVDKRFYFGNYFYIAFEAKTTLSYTKVPVVSGNAKIYLTSIHAIIGLGLEL